uniref:Uncharacterized protein n=1 Tax=Trieres chinensis TaxID=1514140 RepID=A0A7S1ZUF6_TRICV|mmetsp:Transcript_33497/g.68411  ORF Transcript_33497/g.68411 Transcript_33497/m.68411 type:complete len:236 (+) Transcript_33497:74-781(+)
MPARRAKQVFHFDGKDFIDYMDYVTAKRRRNEAEVKRIGLAEATNGVREKIRALRKAPFKKNVQAKHAPSRRRSARKAGKPVLYTGEELDQQINVVPRAKKRSARVTKVVIEYTDEQRATLKTAQDWMDDMNNFLLKVPHGGGNRTVSEDNARTVMRQVEKMVSGAGVTYHHWPSKIVFAKNRAIDLSTNFDELYREAEEYENKYGRDLGNGWLMRHPIVKLKNYQVWRLEQANK